MRILLTGASGLLGSAIHSVAKDKNWTVTPLSRNVIWSAGVGELVSEMKNFDVVVHAAANTNVEQCEINSADCYRDNLQLTEVLASAAAEAATKFVFISSTGVYGALKEAPYKESDPCAPTTVHHSSKYQAECSVLKASNTSLVIRTGWLFGGALENPKNFVARRIEEGMTAQRDGATLKSNAQQFGTPSYCIDVAERVLLLTERNDQGIFNCVNAGTASRFEYVRAIISAAQLSVDVTPANAQDFNRRAPVSNNEMAENWRMAEIGLDPMPYWRDSLDMYVKTLMLQMGIKQ